MRLRQSLIGGWPQQLSTSFHSRSPGFPTGLDLTGLMRQANSSPMENAPAKPVRPKTLKRWLKSTSNRSFALYPVLIFLFEFLLHRTPFHWWGWNVLLGVPFLFFG